MRTGDIVNLRIKSDGTAASTVVEWTDGSAFPLRVHRINITLDAQEESRAFIQCFPPLFDITAAAEVEVTDPRTGKRYMLVECDE